MGLVQAARNCHFTTVAREHTGAGQATKKQLSAGVSPKTGNLKVFVLPFWDCVLLEEDRNENLDPQANTAARSTATQPRAMRKNVSDKTGHIPL